MKTILSAGKGAGKSGSFFFFSYDKKFIIKTMSTKEMKIMFKINDDLVQHFEHTKNQSFLMKIYGIFTI